MAVVYPYESRNQDLLELIGAYSGFQLCLFQNNITPDVDSVFADFTECDFSGYLYAGLTLGPILRDANDNAKTTALGIAFTHNGGGTANDVYGWFLVTDYGTSPKVRHCDRFADAPRIMSSSGDQIVITCALIQGACP